MFFPRLKTPKLTESRVTVFGGLDRTPACPENCFSSTLNTASDKFPLISVRKKRATLLSLSAEPLGLSTLNGITLVLGSSLYYNNVLQFGGLDPDTQKQIVSMGRKLLIFPDGYYLNTLDLDADGLCVDRGYLTNLHSYDDTLIVAVPFNADRPLTHVSNEPPADPGINTVWLDTSLQPNLIKAYDPDALAWVDLPTTHIKLEHKGIGNGIEAGQELELSGFGVLDGIHRVASVGDTFMVLEGCLDKYSVFFGEPAKPILIKRPLPLMDFVCEHQNRIFGCRYGLNAKGEFVNEIYASKLGDPSSFYDFQGLSTDSYAASCGSEGAFTGIFSHMGYVVFFKESKIIRLFGTKPSNYTLNEDAYAGVGLNASPSLALLNGRLFYQGANGIYTYAGSTPEVISAPLGDSPLTHGVAAFCRDSYYLCATENGKRGLYVYDTRRGIWHFEDHTDYIRLAPFNGNLIGIRRDGDSYYLDLLNASAVPPRLTELFGPPVSVEGDLEWSAESGDLGLALDEHKYLRSIKVRIDAPKGSAVRFMLMTDSSGVWEECGYLTSTKLDSYRLTFLPPRCDHLRLKLVGRGDCTVHSITKTFESVEEE